MPSSRLWVGLDVGADELVACITDDGGSVQLEHRLPTSAAALHAVLKPNKRRIRLIGLESGPFGIALTRSLRKLGYRVAMFEARQASKFLAIRRNKTDSNDARGLADVARLGQDSVSEVRVKSPEIQRLRSILVTRRQIVQLRVQTEAAMRSLFRLNGGRLVGSASAAVFRKNVTDELKRLRKIVKVDLTEDVEPLLALSMAMRSYLKTLDERLARRAEQDPVCRRFLAIPGVGPISALSFLSSIEDPVRFRRNADVGAFLGPCSRRPAVRPEYHPAADQQGGGRDDERPSLDRRAPSYAVREFVADHLGRRPFRTARETRRANRARTTARRHHAGDVEDRRTL